jgi:hypothetical protein
LGTSSGAAETIMASHAVHYIMGQRILDKELGIHTGGPTRLGDMSCDRPRSRRKSCCC